MIIAILSGALMTLGVLFMLIAGVGVLRMPDMFLRMSASTKAATLGVGCTMLAVALYFGDFATSTRAIAIAIFLMGTAPVAAHLIGRAGYKDGVPLWSETLFDDLRPHYDAEKQAAREAKAADHRPPTTDRQKTELSQPQPDSG